MADNTTHAVADKNRHRLTPGPTLVYRTLTVSAGTSGDNFVLETIDIGEAVVNASMHVAATLGASCTLQLRIGTTAISGASTAAGESLVNQTIGVPVSASTRVLNILIGGANVSATAAVSVAYFVVRPVS